MEPKYSIPYLPEEQSRKQFAKNFIDSLSQLEVVMDDIFNCITLKITESSEKVTKLKARAEIAQQKVDQLKGRSTATQVFCSPNFPGKSDYEPFKCLFAEKDDNFLSLRKYDDVAIEPHLLDDKCKPLPVIYKQVRQIHKKSEFGIGKLPEHICSVSSTLLYNTQHNIYANYELIDPLSIDYENRMEMKNTLDQQLLAEAPMSIMNADNINFVTSDDFNYLPDLSDLPEFDLPLELPSLPGIANDMLYEGDANPHIGPSYFLPDLPQELEVESVEMPLEESMSIDNATLREQTASIDVTDSKRNNAVLNKKWITTPPSNIPPPPPLPETMMVPSPPPPPPHFPETMMVPSTPPAPPNIAQGPTKKENGHQSLLRESSSDSRSSLMKAIQQAGGVGKANLKRVQQADTSLVKENPKVPAGDYMSDLFSKLAQRRKGISGAGGNKENEPKKSLPKLNPLQQMSAIIPPPPNSCDDMDKVSEDDWDEE